MALPVDKPARMTILHPIANEPMADTAGGPAYIDLYSADSDRARSYNRKVSQRRLDMRGRAVITAASLESENYGLLAELTAGWHLVGLDGEKMDLPFTTQNARDLYTDAGMSWLREQIDAFAGARGNFLKPSANGSSTSPSTNSQASES